LFSEKRSGQIDALERTLTERLGSSPADVDLNGETKSLVIHRMARRCRPASTLDA
jgi:hypothetical protein